MTLPRFRLKLWMLIVLVALVAVGIGAERAVERIRRSRERAKYYATREAHCRYGLAECQRGLAWRLEMAASWRDLGDRDKARRFEEDIPGYRHGVDNWRMYLDYYSRMRQKHERACRFPWLKVPPDPPEPGAEIEL